MRTNTGSSKWQGKCYRQFPDPFFITIPAVVIGGTSLGGGKGGILRTALGVILLTVLNNGLILAGVSPNYQSAISGAILVAAIVVAAWSQRDRLRIAK